MSREQRSRSSRTKPESIRRRRRASDAMLGLVVVDDDVVVDDVVVDGMQTHCWEKLREREREREREKNGVMEVHLLPLSRMRR